MSIDLSDSEDLKSIEKEIELLKSIKNEYLINYLDSFSNIIGEYKIYHVVTDLYQVSLIIITIIYTKIKINLLF